MRQLNKQQLKIYNWLKEHKGYLKCSYDVVRAAYCNSEGLLSPLEWPTPTNCEIALKKARIDFKDTKGKKRMNVSLTSKDVSNELKLAPKACIANTGLKRLFFDIETSPNIVYSWNIGYNLTIDYRNIIQERAIICICYKWEGEDTVHSIQWDKGDDKALVYKFLDIIKEADEVVGHNGDQYDLKWLRTRCLFHGVTTMPEFKSIDTLKVARKEFRFNSKRLDYIGRFLGLGTKLETGGFELWTKIVAENCPESMDKMVDYCKQDVKLLEKVYNRLEGYTKHKTHVGVLNGGKKSSCPKCGGTHSHVNKRRVTAGGTVKVTLHCQDCGTYHTVTESTFNKEMKK